MTKAYGLLLMLKARYRGVKYLCVSKSGKSTYGLSRFFSAVYGKTVPGLAFFSLSLVSVKQGRSYPMLMEPIVRGDTASASNQAVR